jgi:AcrR family transcriptional regulator
VVLEGRLAPRVPAASPGVAKGSFYAHFRDRDELVAAALGRWEQTHIATFTAVLERYSDLAARLRALIELATSATRGQTVISRLLPASEDPRVRAALQRTTEFRLAHIHDRLRRLCRSAAVGPRGTRATRHRASAHTRAHSRTHRLAFISVICLTVIRSALSATFSPRACL